MLIFIDADVGGAPGFARAHRKTPDRTDGACRGIRLLRRSAVGARHCFAPQESVPSLHPAACTLRGIHFWDRLWRDSARSFLNPRGNDERYARPSIDDVELGIRLRRAGHRIWLDRDFQVTPLKEWTLASLLVSDIRDRAIPWSRLILTKGGWMNDLNHDRRNRASAVMLWLALVFATAGFFLSVELASLSPGHHHLRHDQC